MRRRRPPGHGELFSTVAPMPRCKFERVAGHQSDEERWVSPLIIRDRWVGGGGLMMAKWKEQRAAAGFDTPALLYTQGCSGETMQNHQTAPECTHSLSLSLSHTHAHTHTHYCEEAEPLLQRPESVVLAAECVAGCDIVLSRDSAPGFGSKEQQ